MQIYISSFHLILNTVLIEFKFHYNIKLYKIIEIENDQNIRRILNLKFNYYIKI